MRLVGKFAKRSESCPYSYKTKGVAATSLAFSSSCSEITPVYSASFVLHFADWKLVFPSSEKLAIDFSECLDLRGSNLSASLLGCSTPGCGSSVPH